MRKVITRRRISIAKKCQTFSQKNLRSTITKSNNRKRIVKRKSSRNVQSFQMNVIENHPHHQQQSQPQLDNETQEVVEDSPPSSTTTITSPTSETITGTLLGLRNDRKSFIKESMLNYHKIESIKRIQRLIVYLKELKNIKHPTFPISIPIDRNELRDYVTRSTGNVHSNGLMNATVEAQTANRVGLLKLVPIKLSTTDQSHSSNVGLDEIKDFVQKIGVLLNDGKNVKETNSSLTLRLKKPIKRSQLKGTFDTLVRNLKTVSEIKEIVNGNNNKLTSYGIALLDGRYLFVRKIEGTAFFYCIDVKTKQKLMCQVSTESCTKLIEAHACLKGHPHINQIQTVIRKKDKTFVLFAMSQDDLLSYVRKTRMSESEARHLFRQICIIVKSCHEQGIILRDLKLRKFIFTDLNRKHLRLESLVDAVILTDPKNDLLDEKRGCPVYVAPEILKSNQTYYGKAADMWSLGVILYTMVVGRYPFNDTEHSGLFAKISRGLFLIPDSVSAKANCLIRSLLRQDPDERLSSEDILFHPWMNVNDIDNESKFLSTDQCVPEVYP